MASLEFSLWWEITGRSWNWNDNLNLVVFSPLNIPKARTGVSITFLLLDFSSNGEGIHYSLQNVAFSNSV